MSTRNNEDQEEDAKPEASTTSLSDPLDIDDLCDVLWRDGKQTVKAKVVERRPANYRKRKTKGTAASAAMKVDGLKADEIEYYIHYVDHDR